METKTVRLKSSDRLSNAGYHRNGKCWWWARLPNGEFLKLPSVRGDDYLDIEIEIPISITEIEIGTGKRGYGRKSHDVIRETIIIPNQS